VETLPGTKGTKNDVMVEPEEQRRTSQRTKGTHTFRRKYENSMETWEGTEVMEKQNARYRIDPNHHGRTNAEGYRDSDTIP
jgi:hypothetical protein